METHSRVIPATTEIVGIMLELQSAREIIRQDGSRV